MNAFESKEYQITFNEFQDAFMQGLLSDIMRKESLAINPKHNNERARKQLENYRELFNDTCDYTRQIEKGFKGGGHASETIPAIRDLLDEVRTKYLRLIVYKETEPSPDIPKRLISLPEEGEILTYLASEVKFKISKAGVKVVFLDFSYNDNDHSKHDVLNLLVEIFKLNISALVTLSIDGELW